MNMNNRKTVTRFLMAAGMATALCCCGNKTTAAVDDADSTVTDTLEIETENVVDTSNDTIVTVKNTFKKSNDYADVKLEVNLPAEISDPRSPKYSVMSEITKKLWDAFDKITTASYGEGTRMFRRYTDDWTNRKAVINYYGKGAFDYLEKGSKDDLAECMEYWEEGDPKPEPRMYALDVELNKIYESKNHVVFCITWYGYAGGAHGGSRSSYVTFSKHSGKQVVNVIDPKCQKVLQQEMKKGLCEYLDCDLKDLREQLMDLTVIPMPQEPPHLSKDGVVFEYGQYEIGPYAIGMPSFTLPYEKVKDFLLVPIE